MKEEDNEGSTMVEEVMEKVKLLSLGDMRVNEEVVEE